MASEDIFLIKARVALRSGIYGIFAFEIDAKDSTVKKTYSAAGTSDEFSSLDLNVEYKEFIETINKFYYYDQIDGETTLDLENFVKKIASDIDFQENLSKAAKTGNFEGIDYYISSELEHIFGEKRPAIEYSVVKWFTESDDSQESDSSGEQAQSEGPQASVPKLKCNFVLSPLNGVSLQNLRIGQKVFVRFINQKDPNTKEYINRLKKKLEGSKRKEIPQHFPAILKELHEAPEYGQQAVKGIVELLDVISHSSEGDGILAEVIEENRFIRVKTAASKSTANGKGGQANGARGTGGLNGSTLTLIGGILAFLLGVGIIIFVAIFFK